MGIREAVLRYIAPNATHRDDSLANAIDNTSSFPFPSPSSLQGLRKYLRTPSIRRSPQRVAVLTRFCEGLLNRYNETPPHLRSTPFPHPPAECGYSINSHARLSQHRRRQSSNCVMNLVEDICHFLHDPPAPHTPHPLFRTQRFTMRQFIIYLIFRPSQAEIAEMFCSGLLQVWIDNGGGFNHYPAGRSNRSAREVSRGRWAEFEEYAKGSTELVGNVRAQREKVEDVVRELNEQAARLWREVLESLREYSE